MLALGNAPLIPAGSLFTSCIEQVEPLGIQDMRFAKAEYIRALKDLRAADAELQRALAAVELANARYRDAETANLNADTEYQKLLNEYQQLINEARQDTNDFIHNATISAIDSLKKEIELRELTHAKAMVDAERELAQAKEELRVALRNISLAAGDLTGPEKVALAEAVAVYYGLTEEVIKQEYRVFKAQQKVDTLTEYALRFADTAWNGYALVDVDDYYEDAIAWEEAKIAKWLEDYEAIPDSSARVAEWKAYVDKFADRENKLNYELAKIDAEETAITSLMKEGIRDFNMAIAEFIEENWNEKPAGTFTEPTEPDKPGAEPKPTDSKYKVENFYSDSLAFTEFRNTDEISNASFAKFSYLLNSYKEKYSPISDADPKNKIMSASKPKGDTLSFGPVDQSMKTFILGAAGNGEKSQKYNDTTIANYGLWGAYDILERELVTKASKPGRTVEDILKDLNEADSVWGAHRQILINGLAAYEPFTDTVALFELAIAQEIADKDAMDAAIEALAKALNPIVTKDPTLTKADGGAYIDYHDSTQVLRALIDFAAARNEYFDYEYDPENDAHDLNYFRFATGKNSVTGKAIVDSVLFTDLTFEALSNHVYDFDAEGAGDEKYTAGGAGKQYGLANIMNQLLGAAFATKLQTNPVPAFVYDPMEFFGGLYKIESGKAYVKESGSWVAYTPELSTDYEAALKRVAQEYVDVYNSFWDEAEAVGTELDTYIATVKTELQKTSPDYEKMEEDLNDAIDDIEGLFAYDVEDVQGYTKATFKPYSDEDNTPIVVFDGTNIIYTNAMGAILASVDPKANPLDPTGAATFDNSGVVKGAAIFKGSVDAGTDFYSLCYYEYEYWTATNKVAEKDLEYIKTWIEGVEATFTADEQAAPGEATKQYNDDHKDWETTKKNYDTKKAAYDEYVAAKKAFTGTRTVSGKTVINPVYKAAASYTKPITPAFLTDVKDLFATNLVGEYVGWIETLGGEQLANAIKAFGEKPWEQFNEWNETKAQYNAQKTDLAGLKTKAENVFKAEAKMEGYDRVASAADFEAAYKAYVQAYKALCDAIVVYDEFGNIDMNNTTAKVNKAMQEIERLSHEAACYKSDVPDWEGLIAEAQKDLKVQEARLQSLKTACEYAKANYEKLKEYILSQDASYLIPVSVADIQNLLKGLGIDINALIGTYLGNEEEVEPVVEP